LRRGDHVLVVGLVGELLVVAGGADGDAGAVADARDVEARHRGAVVGGVVAAHQVGGHAGVGEVHQDLAADLLQADMNVRVGELDDHAAGAVGAAAEVDGAQLAHAAAGARGHGAGSADHARGTGRGRGSGRGGAERHDDIVAVDARVVRHQLVEVEHHAGAVLGLGRENGVEARGVHVDAPRRQRQRRARQVEGDARRVVDGERQRLRRRSGEVHDELQLLPSEGLHVNCLQAQLILAQRRSTRGDREEPRDHDPGGDAADAIEHVRRMH
jgi:hypothetical protein